MRYSVHVCSKEGGLKNNKKNKNKTVDELQ